MRVDKITGRNFLSFLEFDLTFQKGLLAVVGENRDTPGARSNGSGKSAIAGDAIAWCLYGQTTRGVSGDDVIHSLSKKNCRVTVHLDDGTVIERYRHDKEHKNSIVIRRVQNEVQADRLKDAQEQIDTLIGMDWLTFRQSCLFGQDAVRFLALTDSEKKAVIERIMGVEILDSAATLAREDARTLQDAVSEKDKDTAIARAEIESLDRQKVTLRTAQDRISRTQHDELVALGSELDSVAKELAELTNKNREELLSAERDREHWGNLAGNSQALIDDRLALLTELTDMLSKANTAQLGIHGQVAAIDSGKSALAASIRRLQSLSGSCPTCLQSVPPDHAHKVIPGLALDLERLTAESARLVESLAESKACMASINEAVSQARKGYQEVLAGGLTANERLQSATEKLDRLQGAFATAKETLESRQKRIQGRLAALRKAPDPGYEAELVRVNQQASTVKEHLELYSAESDQFAQLHKSYEFWINAFGLKGMRSMMLDNVLPYLEERCNGYLEELTGGTFKIGLSPVSASRGKEIRDSISVALSSASGADCYEGLSGGERQRVDLACAIALADLARLRSKSKLELLVFDEVFERLDDAGCEAVGALLRKHADGWGTALLVTHLDALLAEVPNRIRVVKQMGVSRVQEG